MEGWRNLDGKRKRSKAWTDQRVSTLDGILVIDRVITRYPHEDKCHLGAHAHPVSVGRYQYRRVTTCVGVGECCQEYGLSCLSIFVGIMCPLDPSGREHTCVVYT